MPTPIPTPTSDNNNGNDRNTDDDNNDSNPDIWAQPASAGMTEITTDDAKIAVGSGAMVTHVLTQWLNNKHWFAGYDTLSDHLQNLVHGCGFTLRVVRGGLRAWGKSEFGFDVIERRVLKCVCTIPRNKIPVDQQCPFTVTITGRMKKEVKKYHTQQPSHPQCHTVRIKTVTGQLQDNCRMRTAIDLQHCVLSARDLTTEMKDFLTEQIHSNHKIAPVQLSRLLQTQFQLAHVHLQVVQSAIKAVVPQMSGKHADDMCDIKQKLVSMQQQQQSDNVCNVWCAFHYCLDALDRIFVMSSAARLFLQSHSDVLVLCHTQSHRYDQVSMNVLTITCCSKTTTFVPVAYCFTTCNRSEDWQWACDRLNDAMVDFRKAEFSDASFCSQVRTVVTDEAASLQWNAENLPSYSAGSTGHAADGVSVDVLSKHMTDAFSQEAFENIYQNNSVRTSQLIHCHFPHALHVISRTDAEKSFYAHAEALECLAPIKMHAALTTSASQGKLLCVHDAIKSKINMLLCSTTATRFKHALWDMRKSLWLAACRYVHQEPQYAGQDPADVLHGLGNQRQQLPVWYTSINDLLSVMQCQLWPNRHMIVDCFMHEKAHGTRGLHTTGLVQISSFGNASKKSTTLQHCLDISRARINHALIAYDKHSDWLYGCRVAASVHRYAAEEKEKSMPTNCVVTRRGANNVYTVVVQAVSNDAGAAAANTDSDNKVSGTQSQYTVDLDNATCTCTFNTQYGLPCRHMNSVIPVQYAENDDKPVNDMYERAIDSCWIITDADLALTERISEAQSQSAASVSKPSCSGAESSQSQSGDTKSCMITRTESISDSDTFANRSVSDRDAIIHDVMYRFRNILGNLYCAMAPDQQATDNGLSVSVSPVPASASALASPSASTSKSASASASSDCASTLESDEQCHVNQNLMLQTIESDLKSLTQMYRRLVPNAEICCAPAPLHQ
jgi:SWIM zinc finger